MTSSTINDIEQYIHSKMNVLTGFKLSCFVFQYGKEWDKELVSRLKSDTTIEALEQNLFDLARGNRTKAVEQEIEKTKQLIFEKEKSIIDDFFA